MTLGQQFQLIIFSFLFGMIFLASYDLFNRVFYKIRGKLVRFVLELAFFSILSTLYFVIIFAINHAVLSVYLPIFIILGALFYLKFVSFPMQCFYEKIIRWIKKKLQPCALFFSRKKASVKLKMKKMKNCIHEKLSKVFKKTKTKKQN